MPANQRTSKSSRQLDRNLMTDSNCSQQSYPLICSQPWPGRPPTHDRHATSQTSSGSYHASSCSDIQRSGNQPGWIWLQQGSRSLYGMHQSTTVSVSRWRSRKDCGNTWSCSPCATQKRLCQVQKVFGVCAIHHRRDTPKFCMQTNFSYLKNIFWFFLKSFWWQDSIKNIWINKLFSCLEHYSMNSLKNVTKSVQKYARVRVTHAHSKMLFACTLHNCYNCAKAMTIR